MADKHPEFMLYLIVIVTVLSIIYLAYAANPAGREFLIQEDGLVEYLTAFFYFMAFVIGLWYWYTSRSGLFLPILSLFGGLEEMAYGERLFGYSISQITGVQTEVLHNIPEMIPYHVKFFSIAFIIGCLLLACLMYFNLLPLQKIVNFAKYLLSNTYFIIFLLFIIPAQTIDLFHIPLWAVLIEETFELGASISLFFAVRHAIQMHQKG